MCKDNRVLVTGGTGFLGKYVDVELENKGYSVCVSSSNYNLTIPDRARDVIIDSNATQVIHLAANVGGIGANKANPGKFFYDNLMMGVNLIEACRIHKIKKVVIIGTICSYPKDCPIPFKEEDLWNGYPEETNAPYGIAKKALLTMAQAYREQYDMNIIYLMPVNLYGPGDNFCLETSHVIPAIIHKCFMASKGYIELWGSGKPTREFIYVSEAARAIVLALESYNGAAPINIGTGQSITICELANKIAELVGGNNNIYWDNKKPNGQWARQLNTDNASIHFYFRSRINLLEGLSRTVEWYRRERKDG